MTLSEADVERILDPSELLDALEAGFRALELGQVQSPPRPEISVPGKGFSLSMPAWMPGMQIAVKVVNVFEGNLELGVPVHLAFLNLFDPETGAVTCVMDGTLITGMRTAASAVLSTRLLSRPESRVATIIGAGVQGREHLRILPLIRKFDHINICSLRFSDACKLAALAPLARAVEDVQAAVAESDIVCLATHAQLPVIHADWIRPGTHISSVGYYPPQGELPPELARNNRLFVETMAAFEPPPVGCSELALVESSEAATLGAVILGKKPGRVDPNEITVYKAMGIAMEDMVAANLAYNRAKATPTDSMVW